jgi:hypothetical protein
MGCPLLGTWQEGRRPLSVMWRAYLDGKSRTENGEISSSGVGEHIYIGQYTDGTNLNYLGYNYHIS